MNKSQKLRSLPSLRNGTIILIVCWSLFIAVLTLVDISETNTWIKKLAKVEAEASYNKDVLYRRWAARNGGVYVPPEKTQPNPYLSHIKTRDIVTTDGKKLTLVNPAYMTRMVHELGDSSNNTYKIKGHITALNPVRPENRPDAWEETALKLFDAGEKEYVSVLEYQNQKQLRFMKPIMVEEGCIKCHDKFKGKVGKIGGGISVAVPLHLYQPAFISQVLSTIITHILIWLFGMLCIVLGARTLAIQNERERKLAKQLKQSQKMDAIGQLAGGIAHDFNNILSIILGYTQINVELTDKKSEIGENLQLVLNASERAKNLVAQLLIFSRKQISEPQEINLNTVITDFVKLLKKGISENIQISCKTDSKLTPIFADTTHIEQILMNLVVNARDAMPNGGTILIETVEKEIDEAYCSHNYNARKGVFNCLMVNDTGTGILKENLDLIFDPFFSTKEVGKGTGLGLSTVFGIVAQHKGFIEVYSEIGKGTTFKIYLPVMSEKQEKEINTTDGSQESPITHEHATILVAEDDEGLARLAETILTRAGYTVIMARNGEEAISLFMQHSNEIELLLFDLIMPKCGGVEAYREICKIKEEIPFVVASGYSGSTEIMQYIQTESIPFIEKPYRPELLLKVVHDTLAAKK